MENKLQTAENNHMSDKMKQENPQIYAKKKKEKKVSGYHEMSGWMSRCRITKGSETMFSLR